MKHPFALRFGAPAALLLYSTGALAIQSYTVHLNGINGEATRYVSPQAVRYVVPGKNQDLIIRLDQGTMIRIDHASRSYSEVKLADMRRALAEKLTSVDAQKRAMMHKMGLDAAPTVTKLGAGETIAGFATERWLVKTPFLQMEIFAAPQLQVPTGYYDAAGLGSMDRLLGNQEHSGYDSIGGCILKQVITGPASGSEMATAVDAHPVPASQFAVPAGYAKKEFQLFGARDRSP